MSRGAYDYPGHFDRTNSPDLTPSLSETACGSLPIVHPIDSGHVPEPEKVYFQHARSTRFELLSAADWEAARKMCLEKGRLECESERKRGGWWGRMTGWEKVVVVSTVVGVGLLSAGIPVVVVRA